MRIDSSRNIRKSVPFGLKREKQNAARNETTNGDDHRAEREDDRVLRPAAIVRCEAEKRLSEILQRRCEYVAWAAWPEYVARS